MTTRAAAQREASLTASIQPHEIPRPMRDELSDIVRRVVLAAAVEGLGHDLMLRVYLAGMYHGALAAAQASAASSCEAKTQGNRP